MTNEELHEQRKYCRDHCYLSEKAKASVPRWAFISALSASMIIALTFGGWHVSSLRTVKLEIAAEQLKNDEHYLTEVDRIIKAIRDNRSVLRSLSVKVTQIEVKQSSTIAKQDLVLNKLGLSNNQ